VRISQEEIVGFYNLLAVGEDSQCPLGGHSRRRLLAL
jgi:hypothetical protein